MRANKEIGGHLLAIITIFIWGTTFISTKILLVSFTPIEILFYRFGIGLIALLVAFPHRLKGTSMRQEMMFAGAGVCGVTLYFLLENIALTYTLASNIGVIISIAPFFTALFSHWFLDNEKLRAKRRKEGKLLSIIQTKDKYTFPPPAHYIHSLLSCRTEFIIFSEPIM